MCTDEQWTRKNPTETLMTSKFWLNDGKAPYKQNMQWFNFWLTPLDVPKEETSWFMKFPGVSTACQLHSPAKLK